MGNVDRKSKALGKNTAIAAVAILSARNVGAANLSTESYDR